MPSGMDTLLSARHSPKQKLPIFCSVEGSVRRMRLVHPSNTPSPSAVTPSGITISVRPPQLAKLPEIYFSVSGSAIVVRLLHSEKAPTIDSSLAGRRTLVSSGQLLHTFFSRVIVSGNDTLTSDV